MKADLYPKFQPFISRALGSFVARKAGVTRKARVRSFFLNILFRLLKYFNK
jgi:hypothetical protein